MRCVCVCVKEGILQCVYFVAVNSTRSVARYYFVRTSSFTLSLASSNGSRSSDDHVPQTNEQQKLVHRSGLEKSIVGINGLWDGLEGVHVSRDTNKVGGNESNDGQHGGTAVTDFALTEPWHEWFVSLGKLQLWYKKRRGSECNKSFVQRSIQKSERNREKAEQTVSTTRLLRKSRIDPPHRFH